MDSLSALSLFVKAAEMRNFTAVGQQLGLSPSAVGKAVSRLEERLGVRLFHRSTRSITLTPEGSEFLEHCHRIFREVEAAEQALMETKGKPRGKIRISMPIAGMLFMPVITTFMQAYPQVELDLDFSDRIVDVIGEGFDAVIRAGVADDSRLMARTLGIFRRQLVASPAYLAQHGAPATPEDLEHHICLQHRFATSGKFEPWPVKSTGKIPVSSVVNTIEPLIYMAEQGLGIACLPDFALHRQYKEGRLVQVLKEYTDHEGIFRILWPSNRYLPPKLRVFIDFMAEHLFPKKR